MTAGRHLARQRDLDQRLVHGMVRTMAVLALVLAVFAAAPGPAAAQSLDELRANGVVGERFDGYAVVRDAGAGAGVKAMVDDINAKRRAIYAERAKAQGVASDQVGRVYAEQILQKAPAGTWFQSPDGKWVQK